MATHEQIIEEFKQKCHSIILNHIPDGGVTDIGGISRISTVVTGMGAQLTNVNTEITKEANNILKAYSNNSEINTSKLKDNLFAVGEEMINEYIKNNKLK